MSQRDPNPLPTNLLDYGSLEGGLARMMDRFRDEGSMTGDEDADRFLRTDPNAALLGLLYDQRVRAEYAFTGPGRLKDRLGHLDMKTIAETDEQALRDAFSIVPAVHRFTNKMADNTRQIARILVDDWNGSAENLWNDDVPFDTIRRRVLSLPGFGKQKSEKMKFVLHYFGWRDFS
jgi:uncharacterized HhH-GPD family protein